MKLVSAAWLHLPETHAVMAALHAQGLARFVGGCVRNTLLGAAVDDIDIATPLTPDVVTAAARAAGLEAVPTGEAHGTITVIANHKPFEVTTLRRDVSADGRRATVAFTTDWAEDAHRRDFHLNALYADVDGTLYDPTGAGLSDAEHGRIRFIGDAHTRIAEDYLRILRFFRFYAWYAKGDPDPDGLAACAAMKAGLAQLSVERVWKELKKLFSAPDPRTSFIAMHSSGVADAVLPEGQNHARFDAMVEIDHAVLDAPSAMARLAALLPDDPEIARGLARRLKLSNDERARLVGALDRRDKIVSYLSPRELRRLLYVRGAEAVADQAKLAWAEAGPESAASQWRALLAMAEVWQKPRLPLSGDEIAAAGVPRGEKIGAVMRDVEAWWIDSDFTDDKLSILERLKAVAQSLR